MQCDALTQAGTDVCLYVKRTVPKISAFLSAVEQAYGINANRIRFFSFHSEKQRADTLKTALMARWQLRKNLQISSTIISRNLYAAFLLGVIEKRPLIFETHQLELGFRKLMQRLIITRPWINTVVISHALSNCLAEHHGIKLKRTIVLPDAAPDGIEPLPIDARRLTLRELYPSLSDEWKTVCGYFGQLYPGRGMDIIRAMAAARPETLFLVFGGNESDVIHHRSANELRNLWYIGHVLYPVARKAMLAVDILLMPYQRNVSIGIAGHDTARWMSPMKMFEYLASGVPLIASDLPALREILKNGLNCILARPDSAEAWIRSLDLLIDNPTLAKKIANQGHSDYREKYTWGHRAHRLLEAAVEK